jgi:glutamate-ammonia-ligase adenylyltransferase
MAGRLSDPDRVLARIDSFVTAYGTRGPLYDAWASHPQFFELLIWLFDRSEFLAEIAIRTPDLVEEMVLSGRLRRAKTVEETLRELRFGVDDADQKLWLRRYQRAEQMRLGLRDLLGMVELDPLEAELTALADACVRYGLEVVQRRHRVRTAPFAVVALGKFGGAELSYGSDLDVIFVAPARTRNLSRLQPFAVELIELLSGSTELGVAFEVDARLRPDGAKGLLVNSLDAFEEYWRRRGSLWELQALTRARFVGGHPGTGEALLTAAAKLTDFSRGNPGVAAWTDDWRQEVVRMRDRIERERTPVGRDALAFKTGRGGLMDAEFLAQTICLAQGWREPNTTRALERAGRERLLRPPLGEKLLAGYHLLRRIELILRRWSFEAESELPADPAPQRRVAIRCGHPDSRGLLAALATARQDVRAAWDSVLRKAPGGRGRGKRRGGG